MSFARPQSAAGVHPDTVRIVAMSAAIALNAAALVAVMRPMVASLSFSPPSVAVIRLIDHPVEPTVVPPPPIDLKPLPVKPRARPVQTAKPVEAPPPPMAQAVPTDEGSAPMTTAPVDIAPPSVPSTPVEATLAYVSAPAPAYPRAAVAARMTGTVTLRVLVDVSGKPLEVVVESSSGHALLDKVAREQVLARWLFQPATAGGRPVQAWARIPVTFNLRKI
ncbi:energy transducer TonB [Luteibacter yeojuensis]|uniref:TonB family protein n=1 Tax=Luteibacter yeojuensis TaxID=345309 RepID=A0A7X5QV23_9GAMM|nr:energy transducer TonB [Luteibacter yeojuensis]NID15854.1 TonB family protein [Luteibacter yeojuensis]